MHSQYLQHMQTGPLGGQEALRENDSQRKRHNEQIFKTMTEEELALERLEVNEVVRKLEESRTFTTREIQPRKAWGSANPSDTSWRRFTGAPRGTTVKGGSSRRLGATAATAADTHRQPGTARTARSFGASGGSAMALPPQRYAQQAPATRQADVPQFGEVTARWASSRPYGGADAGANAAPVAAAQPQPQPAASGGGGDPNLQYIRSLESKIEELSATVNDLRRSQEKLAAGAGAGGAQETKQKERVPPPFKAKVENLTQRYKSNLGMLKTVYQDKKKLEKEKEALKRRVAQLEQRTQQRGPSSGRSGAGGDTPAEAKRVVVEEDGDVEAVPGASRSSRRVTSVEEEKSGVDAGASLPSASAAAQARAARLARIRAMAQSDAKEVDADADADAAADERKGSEGKQAARAPAVRSSGADFHFNMTLEDDDEDDGGGDFAAPPGMDEEDEDEEDAALEESALHGTGPSGAPISRSYPSGRRPATAVAPRSEFGLEPHHTKEFADRVRQEYLADDPLYTTGTASRRSAATGSKGSRSPRPATAGSMASKGKKKKITKPRPFVNMEMRTGTGEPKLGITAKRRAEEEQRRREEEERLLSYKVPVLPIPSSTMEKRYEKLVKEAETTRNANVQKRKEELSSMLQRNERLLNTLANTRKSQEKWERRKAQIEAERAGAEVPLTDEERKREKARREKLRARAMRADFKAEMEVKERLRKEKNRQRAARNLAKAKLPPRMEKWEKKKKQDEARRKAREAKLEKRRARAAARRKTAKAFSFDTEEKKKAAAERRKKLKEKLEREEKEKLEASRAPSRRSRVPPATEGGEFMSKMTNAALKRMQYIRQQREKQEQEAMLERLEEAERKRTEKEASKKLGAVLRSMEKQRLGNTTLAWQKSPAAILKEEKRNARSRPAPGPGSSASAANLWRQQMLSRKKKRVAKSKSTFMFQQAGVEAKKEKQYMRTMIKMEKVVAGGSSSSEDEAY